MVGKDKTTKTTKGNTTLNMNCDLVKYSLSYPESTENEKLTMKIDAIGAGEPHKLHLDK